MVLNSLIDLCFDGVESKYITVNSYGARWVKDIKDNVICLNKQLVKDMNVYLLFNCCFTIGPKIFCQIIVIPMRSDAVLFSQPILIFIFMKVGG